MAILRGQGAFTQRDLLVHCAPKSVVYEKDEDGKPTDTIKGRYLDIQIDQSKLDPEKVASGKQAADTNPYLCSEKKHFKDPNTGNEVDFVSHRTFYSESQYQAMKDAADKKVATVAEPKGGEGEVLGIVADLGKPNSKSRDVIVRTDRPMSALKHAHFGKNILEKQAAVTMAAKDLRDKQRADEKAVEAEDTKAVEAEIAEPEM